MSVPAASPPGAVTAYVGVGSNVEPARHIRVALDSLESRFGWLRVSPVYRNPAVGFEGDDFLNLVVGFKTGESAAAIVAELERLHAAAGRVRAAGPFSSRTLDLDLLLYGEQVIADLDIPRPDILRYGFVLGPLADLAPELRHPLTGATIAEHWARFDRARHPLQRIAVALTPPVADTGTEPRAGASGTPSASTSRCSGHRRRQ
jgi:2-amino-4-hydroxy-6-hydroxymethyldihydropteridine diphosphokinase